MAQTSANASSEINFYNNTRDDFNSIEPLLITHDYSSIQNFAPTLTKVSLNSSNKNIQRAKLGDTIILRFTSSETIVNPSVLIEEKPVNVKNTGANNWEASLVIDTTIEEGYIVFKIDYNDIANNQYKNLNTTTDNSEVIVDNTLPFVISVLRKNPTQQKTLSTTLVYRVTFSEEVTNVLPETLKFNTYGKIKGVINSIAKVSATIYDVTVNITDGGTITLDFINNSGIKDLSSNQLNNEFNTRQTYIINSAPEWVNAKDTNDLIACFNADFYLNDVATILDVDLDQVITWSITRQPKNGVLRGFPLSLFTFFEMVQPGNLLYHPNANFIGQDTFSIKVSDGILSKTLTINLSVHPLPPLSLWVSGKNISKGRYVSFVATGTGDFKWHPAKKVEDSTAASTSAKIMDTTQFILTLTSALGCTSSDTVIINAIEDFYVDAPIVLSPNGDGFNDYFVIENIDTYPENKVQVVDRTGKIIFEKQNYRNDWNGYINNRILVKDSYFYVIWTKGHIAKRGSITVVM
jgi:gliding motility-associated-like protein